MTSKEARQKIDACEQQIVSAYSELKDSARIVGPAAVQAISSKVLLMTLLPLLLCLVAFFVPTLIGGLLVIAGIYLSVKLRGIAKAPKLRIISMQEELNSIIDNNANI